MCYCPLLLLTASLMVILHHIYECVCVALWTRNEPCRERAKGRRPKKDNAIIASLSLSPVLYYIVPGRSLVPFAARIFYLPCMMCAWVPFPAPDEICTYAHGHPRRLFPQSGGWISMQICTFRHILLSAPKPIKRILNYTHTNTRCWQKEILWSSQLTIFLLWNWSYFYDIYICHLNYFYAYYNCNKNYEDNTKLRKTELFHLQRLYLHWKLWILCI